MDFDRSTLEIVLMILAVLNGVWVFVFGRMWREIHELRREISRMDRNLARLVETDDDEQAQSTPSPAR